MRFELTTDQSMIEEQLQTFARQELADTAADHDRRAVLNRVQLEAISAMGMLGFRIPEAYEGAGGDALSLTRAISAIAQADASLATLVALSNGFVVESLLALASEPQKQRWFPPLAEGAELWAWGVPTPKLHDPAPATLTASRSADGWTLKGTINHVALGSTAQHLLVSATNTDTAQPQSLLLRVDLQHPTITATPQPNGLGLRATDQQQLSFERTPVASEDLLTDALTPQTLAAVWLMGHTALAAVSLGVARTTMDAAVDYSKQRQQFGKAIASFQAIQWKLAEMAIGTESARLLLDRAATAWEQEHECFAQFGHSARLKTGDLAVESGQEAIQIHGGYGYTQEFPVERHYRDAQTLQSRWGGMDIHRHALALL